ncbi:MAG: bifunctional 5,10-methylenetetrahydrofolate dehydrogenase/5,10-methenyltetrahydrofolate cyclohydrolase [Alphaproteobacteria bacterium]
MTPNTAPPVAQRLAVRLAGGPLHDALLGQIPSKIKMLATPPKLVVVRVGENSASAVYVRRKLEACARVGLVAEEVHVPATEPEHAFHSLLHGLAHDAGVHAIIVQLPLPEGWDTAQALNLIPAAKDCDGLTEANTALRRAGSPQAVLPATPLGVMRLLQHAGKPLHGTTVAVLGRGRVVGAPLREMLTHAGATVLPIDRDTPHPQAVARTADVLVAAAGLPHHVNAAWVKAGSVVIDVGLSRTLHHGKTVLQGDVNPAVVEPVAGWLTPVPGGVGPMTVASLLTNIVECAYAQEGLPKPVWTIPTL